TTCATERSRLSTAGDQVRSARIEPNASTPMTWPPAVRGMDAFDLGPNRAITDLSTAASAGRSSRLENTMLLPAMTSSKAQGRLLRSQPWGNGYWPAADQECVTNRSSPDR